MKGSDIKLYKKAKKGDQHRMVKTYFLCKTIHYFTVTQTKQRKITNCRLGTQINNAKKITMTTSSVHDSEFRIKHVCGNPCHVASS